MWQKQQLPEYYTTSHGKAWMMDTKEIIDEKGRKYLVYVSPDIPTGGYVTIGPADVVDTLGLPGEIATRLHNILYDRKLFTYKDISAPGAALGALQEALSVDAQKLAEAFALYETEPVGG